ncbi:hypothetical protein PG995_015985 [Apiospora arundinis]
MAEVLRWLFSRQNNFLYNRPGALDRAYGKVWGAGIDNTLPDRLEVFQELTYILEHQTLEIAVEEYTTDYLTRSKRQMASAFPSYYEVEGMLNFLLDHEALVDFLGLSGRVYDKSEWNHVAHVAAFILRMQRQRMHDENMLSLEHRWSTGHHWCAAYLLWEFLYWKHTEWQRQYIASTSGSANPPGPDMHMAVSRGIGLQSNARRGSPWAALRRTLLGPSTLFNGTSGSS